LIELGAVSRTQITGVKKPGDLENPTGLDAPSCDRTSLVLTAAIDHKSQAKKSPDAGEAVGAQV
jgi:hypothetical protein